MDLSLKKSLEDIYNQLNLVFNSIAQKSDRNICGDCHICCSYPVKLQVSEIELAYIVENIEGFSRDRFLSFVNHKSDAQICPNYNINSHSCGIYSYRPMCCRVFGYVPFRKPGEKCIFNGVETGQANWKKVSDLISRFSLLKLEYYRKHKNDITPETVMDFITKGNMLIEEGDFAEAFQCYDRALEVDSGSALAYSYQGRKFEMQNRLIEAEQVYRKAFQLDPEEPNLLTKIGFVMYGQGRYEDSIRLYEEAIKRDPGNHMAYGNMGLAYISMNQSDKALYAYEKALSLDPGNNVFHIMLGHIFDAMGRINDAMIQYRSALDNSSNDPLPYLCIGKMYAKMNQYAEALKYYDRFMQMEKNEEYKRLIMQELTSLKEKMHSPQNNQV